jgi:hypothetical protein
MDYFDEHDYVDELVHHSIDELQRTVMIDYHLPMTKNLMRMLLYDSMHDYVMVVMEDMMEEWVDCYCLKADWIQAFSMMENWLMNKVFLHHLMKTNVKEEETMIVAV